MHLKEHLQSLETRHVLENPAVLQCSAASVDVSSYQQDQTSVVINIWQTMINSHHKQSQIVVIKSE